ncbi:MAG: YdeI/OmpD-associated family protein [Acidimicrobiia bacterium]
MNKKRIEALTRQGLISAAGWAAIEQAQADGSWSQTDEVEALIVPPDLEAAFAASPEARNGYLSLPDSAKQQVLWWIYSAKRSETRERRIAKTIATLEAGGRLETAIFESEPFWSALRYENGPLPR